MKTDNECNTSTPSPQNAKKYYRIIRMKEVLEKTGLCKTTVYSLIKQNKFPKQVQISERAVGWNLHDVDAFIQSRKVV